MPSRLAPRRGHSLHGALLVDKPAGPTSHDVVAFVRRTLDVDRAGHTGTLDPLATGLLIVLVGTATRLAQFLGADEKEYLADVRLGVATPTYDSASLGKAEPNVADRGQEAGNSTTEIDAALARFRGTFLQTPPPYSAKKIGSVPAYEKARRNQPVELKPVEVTVRELEVIAWPIRDSSAQRPASSESPLRLRVSASAGFYVRTLAHDIGQTLGCGGHLEGLRRIRAGRFRVDDALTLDRIEADGAVRLIPAAALLDHLPAATVTEDAARRAAHGNPIGSNGIKGDLVGSDSALPYVRLLDDSGRLLAVARWRAGGLLQPVVVLR